MAAKSKTTSRIVTAAQALDAELARFRSSAENLSGNRLDSAKNLERAAKQLESVAASDERLGACVVELNAALVEAREDQLKTADRVRAHAQTLQERAGAYETLMLRYAELGGAARELSDKLAPMGEESKEDIRLALGQMEGAIVSLLETAEALKGDAVTAGFADVAQQADSVQKQIRTLQSKIQSVAREAAQA